MLHLLVRALMESFSVRTSARSELVDITPQVEEAVRRSGVARGVCHLFVPHTTAGVMVNENADPDVRRDLIEELERLVPLNGRFAHAEGNAAAHIKTVLVGSSESLPVEKGRLVLGTWQGVFLCEFDGPRTRQVYVQLIRAA